MGCVSAVDIEARSPIFRAVAAAARRGRRLVIGSFHDFKRTPRAAVLGRIVRRARAGGADVVKIATFIRRASDVAVLEGLLRKSRGPLCAIGMGPRGVRSRVSLACAGSCLVYGYVDRPAAPGQMSCRELGRRLKKECPGVSPASRRARRA
jgi:3-dehydroquinate dehydratase type I